MKGKHRRRDFVVLVLRWCVDVSRFCIMVYGGASWCLARVKMGKDGAWLGASECQEEVRKKTGWSQEASQDLGIDSHWGCVLKADLRAYLIGQ
jgi:hypothetical protein